MSQSNHQLKNKYNTLTLAEARKLNRSMSQSRAPIRTASVLSRPRLPPHARHRISAVEPPCCALDRYKNSSQKLSDDSYVSARSEASSGSGWTMHTGYGTPQRQLSNLSDTSKRSSLSRASLSTSTYKVLQSPLANLKRFFKNSLPKHFSTDSSTTTDDSANNTLTEDNFQDSLGDSFSTLNRSQTPPVCPPPPGELKSMYYMSNQKEILKIRASSLPRAPSQPPPPPPPPSECSVRQQNLDSQFKNESGDEIDSSWQLTSLPVYYERNLATVFEDQKHGRTEHYFQGRVVEHQQSFMSSYQQQQQQTRRQRSLDNSTYANGQSQDRSRNDNLIKPPTKFEDCDKAVDGSIRHMSNSTSSAALTSSRSKTDSCQSLASTTTTDSILDYQRSQPKHLAHSTPYRFSFAQPLSPPAPINVPTNIGLPPRIPASNSNYASSALTDSSNSGGTNYPAIVHDASKQAGDNNSSSGNSSNCSSQLFASHNSDMLHSLESSDKTSNSDDSTCHATGGNLAIGGTLRGLDNELDATVLSETSTLQGDASGSAFYMNRCAELERTVTALKNKLITKEKELTDLQLNQLNYDYTIDKLKSQVNKLERENQHLRRRQPVAI